MHEYHNKQPQQSQTSMDIFSSGKGLTAPPKRSKAEPRRSTDRQRVQRKKKAAPARQKKRGGPQDVTMAGLRAALADANKKCRAPMYGTRSNLTARVQGNPNASMAKARQLTREIRRKQQAPARARKVLKDNTRRNARV